jgi:hypothetical protein
MNRTTASKQREFTKRGKKPTTYRRIVAGNVNSKSVVPSAEPLLAYQFKTVPGFEHTLMRSRSSALSRGLTDIATPLFQDLAVPACTS